MREGADTHLFHLVFQKMYCKYMTLRLGCGWESTDRGALYFPELFPHNAAYSVSGWNKMTLKNVFGKDWAICHRYVFSLLSDWRMPPRLRESRINIPPNEQSSSHTQMQEFRTYARIIKFPKQTQAISKAEGLWLCSYDLQQNLFSSVHTHTHTDCGCH